MRWTLPACCARAASGHTAAPPSIPRISRRLICLTAGNRNGETIALSVCPACLPGHLCWATPDVRIGSLADLVRDRRRFRTPADDRFVEEPSPSLSSACCGAGGFRHGVAVHRATRSPPNSTWRSFGPPRRRAGGEGGEGERRRQSAIDRRPASPFPKRFFPVRAGGGAPLRWPLS